MASVKSNINQEIEYPEMRTIHPEDRGHPSSVYEMMIKEKSIVVVLGKPKYTFASRDVIYFPIYSLSTGDTIEAQVGVFEILQADSLKIFDDDGDVDIETLGPALIYPSIERQYHHLKSDVHQILQKYKEAPESKDLGDAEKAEKADKAATDKADEVAEEDDAMSVRVPKSKQMPSSKKAEEALETGIFVVDTELGVPPILNEETQEDANEIQQKYKEKAHNPWIQKFMKNANYDVHDVESNGDCFFAVIRDAFRQIGHITTVEKLRALLSEKADETIFRNYRDVYLGILGSVKEADGEMASIKKTVEKDLKVRAKKADTKEETKEITDQVAKLKHQYKQLAADKREHEELIETTVGAAFRDVDTLAKFKDYVQTPRYWGDEWAISTLEYELKIKIILFSKLSYDEGSIHTVMNCGMRDKRMPAAEFFEPRHYIMTSYTGNHYKLISYKDKRIFTFHEIPFHTKSLIVNKCVEQTSGLYSRIQDFRDLLARKGIEPDSAEAGEDADELHDLYDPEVQFNYYRRASKSEAPGKASGEKMTKSKEKDFVGLKKVVEWRKKLDDSWMAEPPIEIEGKRWASVHHYVSGARYKKGFPDFFRLFSMDSDSEISKDVKMVDAAIAPSGKYEGAIIRPKEVKVDPDFEGVSGRGASEREKAIHHKFGDDAELKQLLVMTKDAKLAIHYPKDKYEADMALMRLRRELANR